jgi:integrase/recombinase XerD
VTSYLVTICSTQSRDAAQKTAGAVRSLLRFLHVSAITPTSLVGAVPKVPGHRPRPQPVGLTPGEVRRLLRSCDRRRKVGRRDYAILLLLARLGLRAGEVATLQLDDFDWQHGEVLIRGKGNRHERLPVPEEVGAAVVAYLQRGRPRPTDGCRAVFLRSRAPWSPLTLSGVQTVVRNAAHRCGLAPVGPRRLRHHAATQMQHAGLSLAVVAEVLRHHDTRVTRLYVDVPAGALAQMARVWPGGAR